MAPEIMQKNVSFFNLFSLSAFLKLYVLWIKKLWQIFSLSILSDLVVLKMIMWTFTAKEHCRHRSKWELFQAFQIFNQTLYNIFGSTRCRYFDEYFLYPRDYINVNYFSCRSYYFIIPRILYSALCLCQEFTISLRFWHLKNIHL